MLTPKRLKFTIPIWAKYMCLPKKRVKILHFKFAYSTIAKICNLNHGANHKIAKKCPFEGT